MGVEPHVVAVFQSDLFVRSKEPPSVGLLAWTRPLVLVIVALMAVWHFASPRSRFSAKVPST